MQNLDYRGSLWESLRGIKMCQQAQPGMPRFKRDRDGIASSIVPNAEAEHHYHFHGTSLWAKSAPLATLTQMNLESQWL